MFSAYQSDNTMNFELFKFRLEIKWKFLGVCVAKHRKKSTLTAGNISSLVILNAYALYLQVNPQACLVEVKQKKTQQSSSKFSW